MQEKKLVEEMKKNAKNGQMVRPTVLTQGDDAHTAPSSGLQLITSGTDGSLGSPCQGSWAVIAWIAELHRSNRAVVWSLREQCAAAGRSQSAGQVSSS